MSMSIDNILKKCKKEFMKLDYVVGMGVTKKKGKEIIIIMISKKDASARKIPKKFEGIEIEIMEVGDIKAA